MKIKRIPIILGLTLLMGVSYGETYKTVQITADKLNVRSETQTQSSVLGKLDQGDLVETTDLADGWYTIDYEGKTAYISAEYAEVTQAYRMGYIDGRQVNLRDKPSVGDGQVVAQLNYMELKVHQKIDEWYYVTDVNGNQGYVFGDFITFANPATGETAASEKVVSRSFDRTDLIAVAKSRLGSPYKWGQSGPNSFDCSGFIQYCFKEAYGIDLGHSSKAMSQKGTTIPKDQLEPGDLVFFTTDRSGNVNHVGIYIGGGQFIHASSSSYNGKQVHINPLDSGFYDEVYKWGKRITIE